MGDGRLTIPGDLLEGIFVLQQGHGRPSILQLVDGGNLRPHPFFLSG